MSSEEAPTEQTEVEDPDNPVVSLIDAIEEEEEMMADAAAVLGTGNDKKCSYQDGYLKRQALYSCLTCIPEAKTDFNKGAGICLACTYNCHDGHELVELYTKRNFRCDCGTKKFKEVKCNLINEKAEVNELNKYNQNFSGMYCVCHRPYPDAEDPLPDEMIQCIVCEDWYHTRHLGVEIPANFAEMICEACVSNNDFLLHYDSITANDSTSADIEVDDKIKNENSNDKNVCRKPANKSDKISAKFWPDIAWRKDLCLCKDCSDIYESKSVTFLTDVNDSVQVYEEKNRAKVEELYDESISNSLGSLNRVGLVEFISGYNELKEKMGEFFKKFGENKKVIQVEDVKEFFDGMVAKKKRKIDGVPPANCR